MYLGKKSTGTVDIETVSETWSKLSHVSSEKFTFTSQGFRNQKKKKPDSLIKQIRIMEAPANGREKPTRIFVSSQVAEKEAGHLGNSPPLLPCSGPSTHLSAYQGF